MFCADEDEDVRGCVDILNEYLTGLRTFMKKYPWPAEGTKDHKEQAPVVDEKDEWDGLPTEVTPHLLYFFYQLRNVYHI